MKKLSKKNKIIAISVSVFLILAVLAALLTMFLYVPPTMTDGVNDDVRFRISYFDYDNYFFKNGDTVMPFRLRRPKNADAGKTYPLAVFLHGGGSNGIDNIKSMCGFYLNNLAKYAPEDYYCIAPQAPNDRYWDLDMLLTIERCLAEFVLPSFPAIDADRIYLSGSSMGGRGSIYAMNVNPDRYAAAMFDSAGFPYDNTKPANAAGYYPDVEIDYPSLNRIPMLISHGRHDDVIPIVEITEIVDSLQAAGNDRVTLKIFEDRGHETTDLFYTVKENWEWLFAQSKTKGQAAA